MHFSTFVHRAIRIALLSVTVLLLLTAATLLYAKHVTAIDILMPIVEDSIINTISLAFCVIVGTVSFATALAYRTPIHRLSHDAMMESLEDMLFRAVIEAHQGLFTSVPEHRRAEEIARWLQTEYRSIDAQLASAIGRIADLYLRTSKHISKAELQALDRRAKDVLVQEKQTQAALSEADAVIRDAATQVQQSEVLAEQNDETYARLRQLLCDAEATLDRIAPQRDSNVRPIRSH